MRDDSDVLATGVTTEAIVFMGCTTAELVVIVGVSTALFTPILIFVGFMLGNILYGVGFILVAVGISVVICGRTLQGWKRGRPEGFYQLKIRLWLGRYHLVRCNFVTHDGEFTLGRTNPVVVIKEGN